MTVQELIYILKTCNPDAEIFIETCYRTDSYDSPVESIRQPVDGEDIWLCGEDGYEPTYRGTHGFKIVGGK